MRFYFCRNNAKSNRVGIMRAWEEKNGLISLTAYNNCSSFLFFVFSMFRAHFLWAVLWGQEQLCNLIQKNIPLSYVSSLGIKYYPSIFLISLVFKYALLFRFCFFFFCISRQSIASWDHIDNSCTVYARFPVCPHLTLVQIVHNSCTLQNRFIWEIFVYHYTKTGLTSPLYL